MPLVLLAASVDYATDAAGQLELEAASNLKVDSISGWCSTGAAAAAGIFVGSRTRARTSGLGRSRIMACHSGKFQVPESVGCEGLLLRSLAQRLGPGPASNAEQNLSQPAKLRVSRRLGDAAGLGTRPDRQWVNPIVTVSLCRCATRSGMYRVTNGAAGIAEFPPCPIRGRWTEMKIGAPVQRPKWISAFTTAKKSASRPRYQCRPSTSYDPRATPPESAAPLEDMSRMSQLTLSVQRI
jgi:hypothetical protein